VEVEIGREDGLPYAYRGLPASCFALPWRAAVDHSPAPLGRSGNGSIGAIVDILPKGLMRIRHFGFLANRVRQEKRVRIRQALKSILTPTTEAGSTAAPGYPCPQCRVGRLHVIAQLPPQRLRWVSPGYRP
jgi:hypothetical protein